MSCGCGSNSSYEKQYDIELINIEKHSEDTFSFDFDAEKVFWSEGESSKVYMTVNGEKIGKKFSHATMIEESFIRFTTRIREGHSAYKGAMANLRIGDKITISEPSGDFKLKRDNRPVVLLSNGVGIAAVRGLVKRYEKDQTSIPCMIQLNVDGTTRLYKKELDALANSKLQFASYYLSHRTAFYQMVDHEIQLLMRKYVDEPYVYVVGSPQFVQDNVSHLKDVGFDESSIITDGHASGGCGCSSGEGCGCGGNTVMVSPENDILPVV